MLPPLPGLDSVSNVTLPLDKARRLGRVNDCMRRHHVARHLMHAPLRQRPLVTAPELPTAPHGFKDDYRWSAFDQNPPANLNSGAQRAHLSVSGYVHGPSRIHTKILIVIGATARAFPAAASSGSRIISSCLGRLVQEHREDPALCRSFIRHSWHRRARSRPRSRVGRPDWGRHFQSSRSTGKGP